MYTSFLSTTCDRLLSQQEKNIVVKDLLAIASEPAFSSHPRDDSGGPSSLQKSDPGRHERIWTLPASTVNELS
jgi:hypothetical protein